MIFFAGGMNEPVKFQWKLAAYLDTSNPNNGKKIYNFEFSQASLKQNSKASQQLY